MPLPRRLHVHVSVLYIFAFPPGADARWAGSLTVLQGPERRRVRRHLRPVLQQQLRPAQLQQPQRLGLRLVGQLGQDRRPQQGRPGLHWCPRV